jgi:hypothetical protein
MASASSTSSSMTCDAQVAQILSAPCGGWVGSRAEQQPFRRQSLGEGGDERCPFLGGDVLYYVKEPYRVR